MNRGYNIRTRPINASVMSYDVNSDIQYYNYQPGNGTRYSLLFIWLDPKNNPHGCFAVFDEEHCGGWMITWVTQAKTMFIPEYGMVHYSYVMEKMKAGTSDAIVLAEFIGYVTGLPATSCEEFDPALPIKGVMNS